MAKLLLLDDDAEALEWMSAALNGLGHEVRAFQSAALALADVSSWRPDLILADILMPEMDGLKFARLVRAHGAPKLIFISIAMKQADAILVGAVGYVQKPATAKEVRAAVASVLGSSPRRATILVVDDDVDTRELFGMVLEQNFAVLQAEDGAAALAVLREHPVDLVITDFHMPRMNGVELIRAIRADAALQQMPIIVETSDRVALTSPIWRELKVAYQINKTDFMSWLDRIIGETCAAGARAHALPAGSERIGF